MGDVVGGWGNLVTALWAWDLGDDMVVDLVVVLWGLGGELDSDGFLKC